MSAGQFNLKSKAWDCLCIFASLILTIGYYQMICYFIDGIMAKKCSKSLNSDCQVLHNIKDHNEHLPNMGWVERADSHLKLI